MAAAMAAAARWALVRATGGPGRAAAGGLPAKAKAAGMGRPQAWAGLGRAPASGMRSAVAAAPAFAAAVARRPDDLKVSGGAQGQGGSDSGMSRAAFASLGAAALLWPVHAKAANEEGEEEEEAMPPPPKRARRPTQFYRPPEHRPPSVVKRRQGGLEAVQELKQEAEALREEQADRAAQSLAAFRLIKLEARQRGVAAAGCMAE